jgi:transcription elongation GreA/GreB family factor
MKSEVNGDKKQLKRKLLDHCKSVLMKRIETAKSAMELAQEAANSEGKSSAGDKYETSRAMGQLDRDMNARQLEEAQRDLAFVNSINTDSIFTSVQTGSIVLTEKNSFFISIGLGSTTADNQNFVLLSAGSPVAKMMEGKKAGEEFNFNRTMIKILDVF